MTEFSVMIASLAPALLAEHGVEATVQTSFGDESLPVGLHTIIGQGPA